MTKAIFCGTPPSPQSRQRHATPLLGARLRKWSTTDYNLSVYPSPFPVSYPNCFAISLRRKDKHITRSLSLNCGCWGANVMMKLPNFVPHPSLHKCFGLFLKETRHSEKPAHLKTLGRISSPAKRFLNCKHTKINTSNETILTRDASNNHLELNWFFICFCQELSATKNHFCTELNAGIRVFYHKCRNAAAPKQSVKNTTFARKESQIHNCPPSVTTKFQNQEVIVT